MARMDLDMTEGNIWTHMIRFSVPMAVGLLFQDFQGICDRHHGNEGGNALCLCEKLPDTADGKERTHTVVDGYEGPVRDEGQGILDRVKAGEAAVDQALRTGEIGLDAILPPGGDMRLGKHGNYL